RRHRWLALRTRHPSRNRRLAAAGRSRAHDRTQPRQSPQNIERLPLAETSVCKVSALIAARRSMRHRLAMNKNPTMCGLDRCASEMNWCHAGRYLFARSRHGSTTSTRSRDSTGRRIDPRPKVTGIEIPQRSSLLPYWEGQSCGEHCPPVLPPRELWDPAANHARCVKAGHYGRTICPRGGASFFHPMRIAYRRPRDPTGAAALDELPHDVGTPIRLAFRHDHAVVLLSSALP